MKKLDLRYNLKCILKDREMSQVELAKKLDISPTNLNTRLARGKRCQIDLLDSISKILQVNIDELMTGQAATVINQPSEREEDQMYKEKYLLLLEEMNSVRRENNDLKDEILAKAKPLAKEKIG